MAGGRVASYPTVKKGAFPPTTLSLPNICSMNPHSMQVAEITQRHVDRSAEICGARITREYALYIKVMATYNDEEREFIQSETIGP